ncbi:MAG: ATP-binding protein [Pseudomonadota bacterium]
MKIAPKIASAIIGVTLVTLIAMLALNQWSFDQGFVDYLNDQEITRLEGLASRIAEVYVAQRYAADAPWQPLPQNRLLDAIARSGEMPHGQPHTPHTNKPPPRKPAPAYGPAHSHERRSPEHRSLEHQPPESRPRLTGDASRRAPPHHRRPPPPPPMPATQLRDANSTPLLGPDISGLALVVDIRVGDQVIGQLAAPTRVAVPRGRESQFANRLRWLSYSGAAIVLGLAMAVAWWLARGLVNPLLRARGVVHNLAQGRYDHTPDEHTRNSGDEVGALAADLQTLTNTLQATRSSQRRWIADIAHELRTPITSMQGEIEAMQDGIRPLDQDNLGSLHQEVLRMTRLVNDLHTLTTADFGTLDYLFESLSISTAISDALTSMDWPEGLVRSVDVPGYRVNADSQRLHQLLTNLFSNTIRYTDTPGQIQISAQQTGRRVAVCIEDSAPGVAAEDIERLTDPLYRGDGSRSRFSGGAGLGLAIAARIADAHGAPLTMASSGLGGLAVTFQLRLAEE